MNMSYSRPCMVFSFLLLLNAFGAGGCGIRPDPPATESGKAADPPVLDRHDEFVLRNNVYKGLGTGIETEGRWATHRVIVLTNDVVELHKKKRVATLKLLLEIVKGGRPDDALLATGYAVALEEDPIRAVPLADYPVDSVDVDEGKTGEPGRQGLIDAVAKLLASAEKQQR